MCVQLAQAICDPAQNTLIAGLCRTGWYALFGPTQHVLLPMASRPRT